MQTHIFFMINCDFYWMISKPFPHESEPSMFTNNHNQRVAATVACSQSLSRSSLGAVRRIKQEEKKIPLKFSSRRVVLFHVCASVEVSVLCYTAAWLLPEVCKTRAQYGTRVSAVQLFEPLLLSMMQLFHLVALFSRLTFVLLSVEDNWLAEFNSLSFTRRLDNKVFFDVGILC